MTAYKYNQHNQIGRNTYFKIIDENTRHYYKKLYKIAENIVEHTTCPDDISTLKGYDMIDFVIDHTFRVPGVNLSDI